MFVSPIFEILLTIIFFLRISVGSSTVGIAAGAIILICIIVIVILIVLLRRRGKENLQRKSTVSRRIFPIPFFFPFFFLDLC